MILRNQESTLDKVTDRNLKCIASLTRPKLHDITNKQIKKHNSTKCVFQNLKSLYFFCCCVVFFCSCTFLLRCNTIKMKAKQITEGKARKGNVRKVVKLTFCLAECSATISEKSSSSSCRPRVCFRNCSSYFFSRPFWSARSRSSGFNDTSTPGSTPCAAGAGGGFF